MAAAETLASATHAKRYFVKLPEAAMRTETMSMFEHARAEERPYLSRTDETLMIAQLSDAELSAMANAGAKTFTDIQFEHLSKSGSPDSGRTVREYWQPPEVAAAEAALATPKGLNDVLERINAPTAWEQARGAGVTIAVVDTGVDPGLQEIPSAKRAHYDVPSAFAGNHWQDDRGHGSMCATIAAGTTAAGGRFNGVAPDASLLSARTMFLSTDIYLIYDNLITAKKNGDIPGPLVISNSYGLYQCSPSVDLPEDHPYLQIVLAAVDEGIPVVFAAGNNHHDVLCRHDPRSCSPDTIWAVNSHDRIISVGTVNENDSNRDPQTPHVNSSRGPGQWAQAHPKPDCVAPTYGEVVWGSAYRVMDWWGTSGACPQVAGLAALLLSKNPGLRPDKIADIIRATCRSLGASHDCAGRGMIDCAAAIGSA